LLYQSLKEYIEQNTGIHDISIRAVTRYIGISRSGFKSWLNRKPSRTKQQKEDIKKEIKAIHEESHEIYGAPKNTEKLKENGHKISQKTVGNYMHEMGIKAHYIRPYTITTISNDFSTRLRNILKRDFNPERPDAAWCTDIKVKKLYL